MSSTTVQIEHAGSLPSSEEDRRNPFTQSEEASSTVADRSIKRKFEDAIHNLDEAVGQSSPSPARPTPAKKFKTGRSLYSTLAKYGIKKEPKIKPSEDKLENLSKTAPHLAAILSRTASRTRKAMPFKFGHHPTPVLSSPNSEYRPSSTTSFLARLATFKLTTYANKPPATDAVAAAKCGWINDGKDRLVCGICDVSWVVVGKEGMNRDAANALIEKQRASLVDMHKDGCPWKAKQCDASIYRVPLQTPAAMAREVKSRAEKVDTVLKDVQIKHPLTSAQVQSLITTLASVIVPEFKAPADAASSVSEAADSILPHHTTAEPSETAILTALFGWSILPPAPQQEHSRTPALTRASSIIRTSRATSVAPSVPSTPSRHHPQTPSISFDVTPTPLHPSLPHPHPRRAETAPSSLQVPAQNKPDTTLLHCSLCQRRIGLWAFIPSAQSDGRSTPTPRATASPPQPRRQLDVLKEHRSYCPYAVRSTVVPTLPVSPQSGRTTPSRSASTFFSPSASSPSVAHFHGEPGAIEGWRAVLSVILRYGAAHRRGLSRIVSERRPSGETDAQSEETPMEVDEVEAMVAGVKSHGGRDLLRYVKGLLG